MLDGTSQQAISALPPEARDDAAALAPVSEAKGAVSPADLSVDLNKFLNQVADFADAQANSTFAWERRRQTVGLRKRILGEYYGIYDTRSGVWASGKNEGDGIYYDPTVATFIDDLVSKLVKSRPKLVCKARNPDLIDKREAAKLAEKLLGLDDELTFTPKRQQREWKTNLLCGGETYRITYFNPGKDGSGFDQDKREPVEIEGGDEAHYCALCDGTSVSDDGNCATCGNPQVDSIVAQSTTVMVKKGTEFKQVGDVDYDIPDCLEMTVIGETDDVSEALIVMRDRVIARCVLEDALGQKIDAEPSIPARLRYKQLFADSANNYKYGGSSGQASMREFDLLHYQELWVAPAVYASQTLPKDTQLKGGGVAKAGAKYREAFPDGMYFSRIKQDIYNLYPQSTSECLSHAANSLGEGFHGRGEWDLNELGDQMTEAKSLKFNSAMNDSVSVLLIREGAADLNDFENKPGQMIPVSEDLKDTQLDNIAYRVEGGSLPTEVYGLSDELKGQAQQRVGAFNTETDAPDIRAMGTATGVNALSQNSLGRRGPALELYGQMFVDQAYQKLQLRKNYWPKKMYAQVASDLGDDAVKWFMDCDLKQDIIISVVPDSWMPQLDNQEQSNMQAFMSMFGQVLAAKGDMALIDDLVRKGMQVFDTGLDLGDYEQESVEAQIRLDKLQDVASFTESQFGDKLYDPQTGDVITQALTLCYQQTATLLKIKHEQADAQDIFYSLPIDVMFDDHKEFESSYSDWLRTAEGRAASPFVRLLVRQLAEYHVQAEAYRQLKMNQYSKVPQTADLQSDIVAQKAQQAVAAGDPSNQPPPQEESPHPMQKVAESLTLPDLPPKGKAEVAQQAGLHLTEADFAAHDAAQNAPTGPKEMRVVPPSQPSAAP